MRRKSDIEKMVYEKYPETKEERECQQEKNRLDNLRQLYKKRLMAEKKEKKEYK